MTESATRTEVISAEPVESLAAVLETPVPFEAGSPVPPLWHWLYLLDRRRQSDLGTDGHPTSGIPAPPGPGRRRMFAGGRVTTYAPLVIGEPATKVTSIAKTVEKEGRTGPLTFVTVLQEISQRDQLVIREEQDIVYRAPGTGALPPAPEPPTPPAGPTLRLAVDERLLFRFSALTYNTHRIHYDLGYVPTEGYDGLVIHGPLQALLMGDLMRREGVDLVGQTFGYRLVSPMVGTQTLSIVPGQDGLERGAESRSEAGAICATSTLTTAGATVG
ncbi:FAS1-like dehydratase domain-containing protein [Ornithinimicrobium cryptoxanthini]|uniref:MaoC family dehydratase N-terminal domain-containing protein n=1 Tax=Ornithinimicrobium cryptoxanthini TaxID=2934161 RepID=A0ABY4YH19_9MICO|nr:MaoC family dehydratase N-terminal domain-containing protein [Ornithinimicrobium cryptoxanthini]USQ76059.1 MaoC family dehydratase N-terminal domain-containing protein [Ornithinimicrobium cryptoxanthini]